MKELQDKGYNDIFIPNLIKLSPKYKEYHDALQSVNKKICDELGLYYDSNFQLVMKKIIKGLLNSIQMTCQEEQPIYLII